MDNKIELTLLGTGNAAVTKCYNTCFTLKREDEYLLVDAGGGNGILVQLEKAGIPLSKIHDMYVTHAHTDHILGAVWVVRMIVQSWQKGRYTGHFRIFAHEKAIRVIKTICDMTLPKKILKGIEEIVEFNEVKDGDYFCALGMDFTAFDIASTKEKQFGFSVVLPDGSKLSCLGDEPYNEVVDMYIKNSKWILCEAFCLYEDRDIFSPYEKHHSTALDAGRLAAQLGTENLLLYHTEDKTLSTRKEKYTAEAQKCFEGKVFVPYDLEKIEL